MIYRLLSKKIYTKGYSNACKSFEKEKKEIVEKYENNIENIQIENNIELLGKNYEIKYLYKKIENLNKQKRE